MKTGSSGDICLHIEFGTELFCNTKHVGSSNGPTSAAGEIKPLLNIMLLCALFSQAKEPVLGEYNSLLHIAFACADSDKSQDFKPA